MSSGNGFTSALEDAVKSGDLPDGFRLPNGSVMREEQGKIPINPKTIGFEMRRDVFLIYRHWTDCQRCLRAVEANAELLPVDEGDHVCPHTRKKEYEAVCNDIMSGKAVYRSETENFTKTGDVLISLAWYVPKPKKKDKRPGAKDQPE